MKRNVEIESAWRDSLRQAIAEQAFPGAVLCVGSGKGVLATVVAGWHTFGRQRETRADDLFDLASLTKVVGTTAAAMRLHGRGQLDLAAPVADLLPDFAAPDVTAAHLLAHASGLPAYVPFHREPAGSAAAQRARVLATPLAAPPGEQAVYSDIGMMVLGYLLADLTGLALDKLIQAEVCVPLGMVETQFCPPADLFSRCVPTECGADGTPRQGVVHDENAAWLGGVAGHAGLFAPAADLARLAVCLLRGGESVFGPGTLARFTRPAGIVPGSKRCLGWDGVGENCSGGRLLGPHAYGHTGFTGTSLWLDPDHDRFVILLTNAVHPQRQDKASRFFPWRRRIHETVCQSLDIS